MSSLEEGEVEMSLRGEWESVGEVCGGALSVGKVLALDNRSGWRASMGTCSWEVVDDVSEADRGACLTDSDLTIWVLGTFTDGLEELLSFLELFFSAECPCLDLGD